MKEPSPEQKQAAFVAFREELDQEVEHGIEHHEASMTTMGVRFQGMVIGVIALAALLP
jgi:hypothetical protein